MFNELVPVEVCAKPLLIPTHPPPPHPGTVTLPLPLFHGRHHAPPPLPAALCGVLLQVTAAAGELLAEGNLVAEAEKGAYVRATEAVKALVCASALHCFPRHAYRWAHFALSYPVFVVGCCSWASLACLAPLRLGTQPLASQRVCGPRCTRSKCGYGHDALALRPVAQPRACSLCVARVTHPI